MKCPNCSNADFSFYPDEHIAYYDQFWGSWAEAMVYTCPECGYSELMRLPQGSVQAGLGQIPTQLSQALAAGLAEGVSGGRSWLDEARAAKRSLAVGNRRDAAVYAYEFVLRAGPILDITWLAWALALAEESGLPEITMGLRRIYLDRCREYRREYLKRGGFAHRMELLGILDNEIARLAPDDRYGSR